MGVFTQQQRPLLSLPSQQFCALDSLKVLLLFNLGLVCLSLVFLFQFWGTQ